VAVAIAESLLSGDAPQRVLVTVSGMSVGSAYVVTAASGALAWSIPGGSGVSDGSTLRLVDDRTPLGAAVTYTAVVAGAPYTAGPVTVAWSDDAAGVVQSLDGRTVVPVEIVDWSGATSSSGRAAFFAVAGRATPVARYDVTTIDAQRWSLETDDVATYQELEALLRTGAPVVLRTIVQPSGAPAVRIGQPTKWAHALISPLSPLRSWSLDVQLIDDPSPSTPLAGLTWDDFDAAMVGRTWAGFDTVMAGLTWNGFDTYDWTQL